VLQVLLLGGGTVTVGLPRKRAQLVDAIAELGATEHLVGERRRASVQVVHIEALERAEDVVHVGEPYVQEAGHAGRLGCAPSEGCRSGEGGYV